MSVARAPWRLMAGMCLVLPFVVGQGCPPLQPGGGATVVVRSPSIDLNISAGDVVTIVYDASAGPVNAFYDQDGAGGTGDEITFATNLQTGDNRFTQLQTASLAPGTYFIGITAAGTTAYAPGKVIVGGAPSIAFTSPVSQVKVGPGINVPVRFSAGVAEFTYIVFYDEDGVLNGDEVTITSGSSTSAIVETSFSTSGLLPGTYHVGVRVTVPSGTATAAYAPGLVELVSGAFVQVLSPTIGLVTTPGSQVQISIAASDPSSTASTVRIFYDPDNIFDNGNDTTIIIIPVTGGGTVWDTTGVLPGSYYIGAELQNGFDPPAFSYSPGAVSLIEPGTGAGGPGGGPGGGTSLLTVTTPLNDTSVFQGTIFRVNWLTSLRAGEATVRVFREPDLDGNDQPDGAATRVTIGNEGIDARTQFVDFDTTGVSGTFFIGVTLTPNVGDPVTEYAPGTLTVSPLKFWVGNLATRRNEAGQIVPQTGAFQGAIFRGFNFMDNLGSAMLQVDDYDGDGRNEILLAAQFAKPFLFTLDGRGAGEAYMIYGQPQRFRGDYDVNDTGSATLPGVIFTGILPNPLGGGEADIRAKAGSSDPYRPDGTLALPFDSEGLRSVALIPDQDGDGKQEIAFGFPWVNSYSLAYQNLDGIHPAPLPGIGRLENNGHFLRGGVVIVSSRTPVINDRQALSRTFERVVQLHEVGQIFGDPPNHMEPQPVGNIHVVGIEPQHYGFTAASDSCGDDGVIETITYPCEGFWQDTVGFLSSGPRLADPMLPYNDDGHQMQLATGCQRPWNRVLLSQVDPPLVPNSTLSFAARLATSSEPCPNGFVPFGFPSPAGLMNTAGTGFYTSGLDCGSRVFSRPNSPFGCRILGQTSTQPTLGTLADRFGASVAVSGGYLLIGAPQRTVLQTHVPNLPTPAREQSGEVYLLRLTNYWNAHDAASNPFPGEWIPDISTPAPHNYIIQEGGYTTLDTADCGRFVPSFPVPGDPSTVTERGGAWIEMTRPLHVVGAAPGDRIGEVTGLHDVNNDGVSDFAVGGAGTNGNRGAVYVIYRRPPEIEGNYLLELLQLDPTNVNRLNGLMILGEPGENLGTAIAGGGALNDDYNDDGFADILIGSPLASPASGLHAGEAFIVFGGTNLLNPAGGITRAQLRAQNLAMVITGASPGDMAGTTVANAGDVNGDGVADILIAAPNATPRFDSNADGILDSVGLDLNGDGLADDLDGDGVGDDLTQAGIVYIVFGGKHLTGTLSLADIGTAALPGFMVVGRRAGDQLGGGHTQDNLLARGVAAAGDVDGDGRGDVLLSSVLASPQGKTHAGEVYLIYGVRP